MRQKESDARKTKKTGKRRTNMPVCVFGFGTSGLCAVYLVSKQHFDCAAVELSCWLNGRFLSFASLFVCLTLYCMVARTLRRDGASLDNCCSFFGVDVFESESDKRKKINE